MYKYKTHLHTAPVKRCTKANVEESLIFIFFCYDSVFITNHFLDGYVNFDKTRPYENGINFYFSDYEKGVELSSKIGIKVFCKVELSDKGTDFLIYGLDKQWYLEHPEIIYEKKSDELSFMREHSALIIQAHPFRDLYVDHIRLYPKHVHGTEIINASRKDEENSMSKMYCEHYVLIPFAGSDNHTTEKRTKLAGICFEEPIKNITDFIQKVKNKQAKVFTFPPKKEV